MSKANLRISRKNNSSIEIEISCEESGATIIELNMDLASFAEAITGLGSSKSEIKSIIKHEDLRKVGKKKEIKSVYFQKRKYEFKDNDTEFRKFIEDQCINGWTLWNDGMRSKQNSSKGHEVILARWVEKEDLIKIDTIVEGDTGGK